MDLYIKIRDILFPSLHTWKEFDCLSTISTPLVLIIMPMELRSFKAKRYLIFKPMSHLKLSERTQLFSSPSYTKFCDMDIDEIPEFLFARADKNDLMVTFHEGLFLYYEHQAWLCLKFRGKNYFVVFFYVKIKASCPRAELPPVQVCCAFDVLEICFKLYLI